MKKIVMVIGSSSFSGSWMVKKLIEKNYRVVGISRSNLKKEYSFVDHKKFKFYKIDINKNFKNLKKIIKNNRPSIIINFVAQSYVRTSWDSPEDWMNTNIVSLVRIINFLKDKKYLKKFLQISTPEIYGNKTIAKNHVFNPTTPYALSKLTLDIFLKMMLKKYNFPIIFVRSANVYGEGQKLYRIIPKTIINFKKNKKIYLDDKGEIYRSFIHISDNSNIIYKILIKGKIGQAYHPSTDKIISLKKLIKLICIKLNVNWKDKVVLKNNKTKQDKYYKIYNSKEFKELKLKNKFITMEKGLERTISWIERNWSKFKFESTNYEHKK